jgi:glycerate-2-kinase
MKIFEIVTTKDNKFAIQTIINKDFTFITDSRKSAEVVADYFTRVLIMGVGYSSALLTQTANKLVAELYPTSVVNDEVAKATKAAKVAEAAAAPAPDQPLQ